MTSDIASLVRQELLAILAAGDPYTGMPLVDPDTNLLAPPVLAAIREPLETSITDIDESIAQLEPAVASLETLVQDGRLSEPNLTGTIGVVADPIATRKARILGAILSARAADAFPGPLAAEPATGGGSSIGGAYTKLWYPNVANTGPVKWSGFPIITNGSLEGNPTYITTGPSSESVPVWWPKYTADPVYWETNSDAPYIAFMGLTNAGSPPIIEIDGKMMNSLAVAAPGKYWYFDWKGVRKVRNYRIYASEGFRLGAVVTTPIDTVFAPRDRMTVGMMTDSYGQGSVNVGEYPTAIPYLLGRLLAADVRKSSYGGSGYQTTGSMPGGGTFLTRAAYFDDAEIDVMLWMGGINDSATGLQAAAEACYAAFAAAHPGVPQIAVGPWSPSSTYEAANGAKWTAIQAACAAQGVAFIDNRGWITGTGRVGATVGDGNADVLISSDGTHPEPVAGRHFLASKIAAEVTSILLEGIAA